MADIIDKIGKYFAEQEKQLHQVYVQTAPHAAMPPTTYPHRSSVHQPLPPRQQQHQTVDLDTLPGRNAIKERQPPSLLRRRLSQQSSGSPSGASAPGAPEDSSQQQPGRTATPATTVPAVPAVVLPLVFFPPSRSISRREASAFDTEDAWSESNDDDFASWRSAQSSHDANLPVRSHLDSSAARPEVEFSDEEDGRKGDGSQASSSNSKPSSSAKPRKIPLKRRDPLRKKRRSSSSKHLLTEPDPEQVKLEKERKVAAALVLAQERAKRIQAEREQQMRGKQLANREEQRRVQDEMEKIEAIRFKSKQFALRLRPSSAPSTPGAPSGSFSSWLSKSSQLYPEDDTIKTTFTTTTSNNSSSSSRYCPAEVDNNEPPVALENGTENSPTFLDNLKRQLRDRMVIELRVREKSLASQQIQEQEWGHVHSQLEKQNARNEKKQQQISQLEAAKQALEKELGNAQEQLQALRSQRLELEETSRRERVQRQRDAERQLRARVRSEEWNRMLDDEKTRSEVAAEARERASQRVVSRLKKKAFELKEKSLRRRRSRSSSNNNEKEEEDEFERLRAKLSGGAPKLSLLFAPELAEFEEDGLLSDDASMTKPISPPKDLIRGPTRTSRDPGSETREAAETTEGEPSVPETDSSELDKEEPVVSSEEPKFEWRVPPFNDRRLFDRMLLHEMLYSTSDSD